MLRVDGRTGRISGRLLFDIVIHCSSREVSPRDGMPSDNPAKLSGSRALKLQKRASSIRVRHWQRMHNSSEASSFEPGRLYRFTIRRSHVVRRKRLWLLNDLLDWWPDRFRSSPIESKP